jgi:hypothetical protein
VDCRFLLIALNKHLTSITVHYSRPHSLASLAPLYASLSLHSPRLDFLDRLWCGQREEQHSTASITALDWISSYCSLLLPHSTTPSPMSGLTAPIFNGTVTQCQDVVVSWTVSGCVYGITSKEGICTDAFNTQGGEYPVRVEACSFTMLSCRLFNKHSTDMLTVCVHSLPARPGIRLEDCRWVRLDTWLVYKLFNY